LGLVWHDPSLRPDPSHAPTCHWHARGIVPLTVHRSSFDSPAALYAAIKGGSPSANHGHMDAGSFILQSEGIVWALDLGMQEYHSLESLNINIWDRKENGARWSVFRLGPESHNILRFNSAPQRVDGRADFLHVQTSGNNPCSVLDMSSLYENQVKHVRRGMMFVENRAVLIQDEWLAGELPVEVAWQMLTAAEVHFESGTIHLLQDGKGLDLHLLNAPDAIVEVTDVARLQQPYDAANPGVQRLTIRLHTKPHQSGVIRILALPQTPENRESDPQRWDLPRFDLHPPDPIAAVQ
jgi:oligo-alginate lyase